MPLVLHHPASVECTFERMPTALHFLLTFLHDLGGRARSRLFGAVVPFAPRRYINSTVTEGNGNLDGWIIGHTKPLSFNVTRTTGPKCTLVITGDSGKSVQFYSGGDPAWATADKWAPTHRMSGLTPHRTPACKTRAD